MHVCHAWNARVDSLVDWLMDWLTGWLIDWLIDWLKNVLPRNCNPRLKQGSIVVLSHAGSLDFIAGAGDKRRAWPGVVKGQYPQRSDRECLGTRQSLICLSPRLCQLESMRFEVMQITSNCQNSIVFNAWLSPCALWGLSFEWSHQRISSTDSKVRVTSQNSIKHSGSERVNTPQEKRGVNNPTTPQRATRTTSLTLKAVGKRETSACSVL